MRNVENVFYSPTLDNLFMSCVGFDDDTGEFLLYLNVYDGDLDTFDEMGAAELQNESVCLGGL